MKKLAFLLIAATSLLSACVAYEVPNHGDYRGDGRDGQYRGDQRGDRDRDGIPNHADRDRDGDGVRNSRDARPNDARRY